MVTPAHVDPNRYAPDELSYLSCFTGVLMRREGDFRPLTLEGAHCTILLGDDNGRGFMLEGAPSTTVGASWQDYIGDLTVGTNIGGGAIEPLGGSFTYTKSWTQDTATPRQAIDYAVGLLGAIWEVDDTMFLNAGLYSWMFEGSGGGLDAVTPAVIVDLYGGPDPLINVFPGSIHMEEDIDSTYAARVLMDGGSAGAVGAGGDTPYLGPDGLPIKWKQKSTTSTAASSGDLSAQASAELALIDAPSALPTFTCTWPFINRYIRPGQIIGVWDPVKDLQDYTTFGPLAVNETLYRGRQIYPAQLTVQTVEMPWTPGGGLYAVLSSDNTTIVDLTRWVVPEDKTVTIEVGAKPQSLKQAVTQRGWARR
jgi:hypothetical protein